MKRCSVVVTSKWAKYYVSMGWRKDTNCGRLYRCTIDGVDYCDYHGGLKLVEMYKATGELKSLGSQSGKGRQYFFDGETVSEAQLCKILVDHHYPKSRKQDLERAARSAWKSVPRCYSWWEQ